MFWKNVRIEGRDSRDRVRQWSIAGRLTALYAASSFLMLVLAASYLYWSLAKDAGADDTAFLSNKIQECRRLLRDGPNDMPLLAHEIQTEAAASQFIKYYVRLSNRQGKDYLATPGMSDLLPSRLFPLPIPVDQTPTRGAVWESGSNVSYLLMSAWAGVEPDGTPLKLEVALDDSSDEALIKGYRWKLLGVVVLGMFFACGASILIARNGLHPVKEITQATERITATQLHERLVPDGWPVELASLARSFDQMLDRLEDSFNRLSQFSADLAHELRTPINNLRGEAGVALSQTRTPEEYRRTLESSLEEYARLSRLIDNLLFLARADGSKMVITRAPCDVQKSVEVVREFYEALAEDRGVEVACEGEGIVNADPMLLRQAVSNLLSNALNYTPPGGRVVIHANRCDGRSFAITVSDTGSGIATEHLPHVFDRLYRVDPSRSQHPNGAGLGLAIVKSIMALHGGSVAVQSESGKGSTFTLTFPPTPTAPPPT
jgi:two-component system heavy metal sensor histidine kinase CusS